MSTPNCNQRRIRIQKSFILLFLLIIVILCIQQSLCTNEIYQVSDAEKLVNKILNDTNLYNKDIRPRPSGNNGTATVVSVNVYLRSINSIDDIHMDFSIQTTIRQEWEDPRLKFDHADFVTIPEDISKLWTPDLFFANEKESKLHNVMKPNILIRVTPETGNILLSSRLSLTLSCPMDLKYYPLDHQTCSIRMGSYSWSTKDLVFRWKNSNAIQLPDKLHLARFKLLKFTTGDCNSKTATGEYSCLLAEFTFRRELGYYMIQNFLPCGMIVMVSWISFWLGTSTIDARVSLGITTMLTMVAQIYGINQSVPPVSYTKALDVFTGGCTIFIVLAIIEVSIVGYNVQLHKYRQSLSKISNMGNISAKLKNEEGLLQRSQRVDFISRILFPLLFLMFNVAYWHAYMFSERGFGQ